MTSPRAAHLRSARWLAGGVIAAVLAGCAGEAADPAEPEPAAQAPAAEDDAAVEEPDESAEPAADAPADEEPADDPTADDQPADSAGDDVAEIAIRDDDGFVFEPAEVNVSVGETVTWVHEGSISHTVTADDGSFDSGTLAGGDTFEVTFDEPGSYPYTCSFHGSMQGTVTVE
jgi:plastocyanin